MTLRLRASRTTVSRDAVCGNGDMLLACVRATGELVARCAGVHGRARHLDDHEPARGVRSGFPDPLRVMLGLLAVAIATAYILQSIT